MISRIVIIIAGKNNAPVIPAVISPGIARLGGSIVSIGLKLRVYLVLICDLYIEKYNEQRAQNVSMGLLLIFKDYC